MKIINNVPLSPFTTFKLGGKARYFVAVHTNEDLVEAVLWAKKEGVKYIIIGGGSNILVSDKGFSGLIIRNQIKGIEYFEENEETHLSVGAGENWDDLVLFSVNLSLYGLENLSGIPGSVGATPVQNVGAYGRDVSQVIEWVEALNTDSMKFETFTKKDCSFNYRDSFFKTKDGKKYIIVKVGFKLAKNGEPDISYKDLTNYFKDTDIKPTLKNIRAAILNIRAGKFPDLNYHGCGGSFFKNPVISKEHLNDLQKRFEDIPHYEHGDEAYKVPLAWVLEHAVPWKGVRRKNVGVSDLQPLILVNYGGGSAKEIKRLSDDITKSISNETRILISPEVRFVGDF